jgi:hypothetical protein
MKTILVGNAANEIRARLGMQIQVNRRLAVEIGMDLDEKLYLAVYARWPKTPWWRVDRFTIEIRDGVAVLPDNMPIPIAVNALNAAAGRRVAKARRLGALCPQCNTAHGEWVESAVGVHCALCGWVVRTRPRGHVGIGDRFWIPIMGRVVVHPRTKVRVLQAHNQVTGCAADESQRARPGELPEAPLELRDVPKALPGYEYIQVEVVELPREWKPTPYK